MSKDSSNDKSYYGSRIMRKGLDFAQGRAQDKDVRKQRDKYSKTPIYNLSYYLDEIVNQLSMAGLGYNLGRFGNDVNALKNKPFYTSRITHSLNTIDDIVSSSNSGILGVINVVRTGIFDIVDIIKALNIKPEKYIKEIERKYQPQRKAIADKYLKQKTSIYDEYHKNKNQIQTELSTLNKRLTEKYGEKKNELESNKKDKLVQNYESLHNEKKEISDNYEKQRKSNLSKHNESIKELNQRSSEYSQLKVEFDRSNDEKYQEYLKQLKIKDEQDNKNVEEIKLEFNGPGTLLFKINQKFKDNEKKYDNAILEIDNKLKLEIEEIDKKEKNEIKLINNKLKLEIADFKQDPEQFRSKKFDEVAKQVVKLITNLTEKIINVPFNTLCHTFQVGKEAVNQVLNGLVGAAIAVIGAVVITAEVLIDGGCKVNNMCKTRISGAYKSLTTSAKKNDLENLMAPEVEKSINNSFNPQTLAKAK